MGLTKTVLNYKFQFDSPGLCSIRQYLVELSRQCWIQEDCFNGKRPFGNSGWKIDIYIALAEGGFINGEFNGEEWTSFDEKAADKIIMKCFKKLARTKN